MYQVPAWRQAGEVQSTELEIHWKYDRNRLRCACLPQALAALQPASQNYWVPSFFILAKTQRRKGIERSFTNLLPAYRRQ
jgi:hypothetical protein